MTFALQQGQLLRLRQPLRLSIVRPQEGMDNVEFFLRSFARTTREDFDSGYSHPTLLSPRRNRLNGNATTNSKFFLAGSVFFVLEHKTVNESFTNEAKPFSMAILLHDTIKYSLLCEESNLSELFRELA